MPVNVCLGKLPARKDERIPHLSAAAPGLPAPPPSANWYSSVKTWGMLGNDQLGDCVEAAVLHCIEQMSGYAMQLLVPTTMEAVKFYENATGYIPGDASTDQGSFMLGQGGVIDFWYNNGVMCGGKLNKVTGFLQIAKMNPIEWMQGIHYFSGMLTGLNLPESIVSGDTVPSVWADYSGPVAGGHEIYLVGYETMSDGTREYDLVSWGEHYRATEQFLLSTVDETIVVVDPIDINARGVDTAGFSMEQLVEDMKALHVEG